MNIAAPIFDCAGCVLASLEVLAPAAADPPRLIAALRSASRRVSEAAARMPRVPVPDPPAWPARLPVFATSTSPPVSGAM